MEKFKSNLLRVESLICKAVRSNMLGYQKFISMRNRLDSTRIAKIIGLSFESDLILAIDYYGYVKKSTGLLNHIEKYNGVQLKKVESTVVHLNSIKIGVIGELDYTLLQDFLEFKNDVFSLRGLNRR